MVAKSIYFEFEQALNLIREGKRVGRKGWRTAVCVFLVDGSRFTVSRPPLDKFYEPGTEITYRPHIDMVGVDGSVGVWTPSMVDLLADDWYQLEDES